MEGDAGDALWAMMVAWLLNAALGPARSLRRWLLAVALSAAVELSQCVHFPWIDAVRATRIGGLLFGHAFSVHDLALYFLGASTVAALDAGLRSRWPPSR